MTDVQVDFPPNAIRVAVERLNRAGVFADEDRKFPGIAVLRRDIAQLEDRLRSNGYRGGRIQIEDLDRPREGVEFVIYDSNIGASTAESRWYLDYQNRWHDQVAVRVDDWIERLGRLKELIRSWLPSGLSIVERPPTKMHEELMRKFNVPAAEMPTFEIVRGSERLMRVQPKGLWVIGANGRVDLITARGSWILVDESTPLAERTSWRLYSSRDRRSSAPLDRSRFIDLLG